MASVEAEQAELPAAVLYRRTASTVGWIVGFFLAMWGLGIAVAVPATTLLYFKLSTGEKWSISLLFAAGLWLLVYGLFIYTLHIPFPEGLLWRWFG